MGINDNLLNHDDEKVCPNCQGSGRITKGGELITEENKKESDLTIKELPELIIQCIRDCKKQDADKQYGELWLKRKKELNPLF